MRNTNFMHVMDFCDPNQNFSRDSRNPKEALIVVDGVEKTVTVQNEIILLQKEIIKKQNKELMDSERLLKLQNDLIKDLIKRIKGSSFDPDKWI